LRGGSVGGVRQPAKDPPQLRGDDTGARRAFLDVLLPKCREERVEICGEFGVLIFRHERRLVEDLAVTRGSLWASNGWMPTKSSEQHETEREQIRLRRHRHASELFRRHVEQRSGLSHGRRHAPCG
jgi:hypothetical protein